MVVPSVQSKGRASSTARYALVGRIFQTGRLGGRPLRRASARHLFTAFMNPSINASTSRSCKTILFPQNMRRAGRPLPAAARRVCAPYKTKCYKMHLLLIFIIYIAGDFGLDYNLIHNQKMILAKNVRITKSSVKSFAPKTCIDFIFFNKKAISHIFITPILVH